MALTAAAVLLTARSKLLFPPFLAGFCSGGDVTQPLAILWGIDSGEGAHSLGPFIFSNFSCLQARGLDYDGISEPLDG